MSVNLPPFPSRDITPFSRSQSMHDALRPTSTQSNTSTTSLGTVYRQHRRVSATSVKSASSTPLESPPVNNENQDPFRSFLRPEDDGKDVLLPKGLQIRKASNAVSHKSSWGTDIPVPPRSRGSSLAQESGPLDNVDLGSSSRPKAIDGRAYLDLTTSKGKEPEERIGTGTNKEHSENRDEKNIEATAAPGKSTTSDEHPFKRWVQTLRRIKSSNPEMFTAHVPGWSSDEFDKRLSGNDFLTIPPAHERQSKRSSLASSGFVTGMRTATVSVESSSLMPDSRRNTTFSENQASNRRSYLSQADTRMSGESGRAMTVNSMDDAAWHRGVKRRQIIQELVSSEESYVADMKVLVNVYFTLLASTPALTSRTRSSIQQNVMEILHMHEELLKKLHRVVVQSEILSHSEEPKRKHIRWRSLDLTLGRSLTRSLTSRKRRSAGIPSQWIKDAAGLTAAPAEAAEVVMIFKGMMTRFFAYEEYSAKYEMMVRDVASTYKYVSGWHAYEMGLEALATSLASINTRDVESKKGLTFSDLLIKPIQRVCKYPLFFGDLLKQTPVFDCPESHAEISKTLEHLREAVREINKATDDRGFRDRLQRTWLLEEKLVFPDNTTKAGIFPTLGHSLLCGVLHVAYQTKSAVQGEYMLCVLFKSLMLLATASEDLQKFHVVACLRTSDIKVETTEDNKGLQCHSAPYTWKLVFESDNRLFELVLSACSAKEEDSWKSNLLLQSSGEASDQNSKEPAARELFSTTSLDLKPAGQIFGQPGTLARRLSIQRAATVGTKSNAYQIIIKNTHVSKDGSEQRYPLSPSMNRSQSLLMTHRIPILAPKRSDRIRIENVLADVWTKDILPYPGMVAARGDQIKASANSVIRKLSLANMSAPFARSRSTSLIPQSPCKSKDDLRMSTQTEEAALGLSRDRSNSPVISERGPSRQSDEEKLLLEDSTPTVSMSGFQKIKRSHTRKFRKVSKKYKEDEILATDKEPVEEEVKSKKRWSNPFGIVKSIGAEGFKSFFG